MFANPYFDVAYFDEAYFPMDIELQLDCLEQDMFRCNGTYTYCVPTKRIVSRWTAKSALVAASTVCKLKEGRA